MKAILFTLAAAVALGNANCALAAADSTTPRGLPGNAAGAETSSGPAALPLDHGPHAVTTPWLNQQRLAAAAAKEKEAKPAAAPDSVASGSAAGSF